MSTAVRIRVLILEDKEADAELMVRELRKAGLDPAWERVDTEQDFAAKLTPELDLILSDHVLTTYSKTAWRGLVRQQCRRYKAGACAMTWSGLSQGFASWKENLSS